jgi:hypothetical protein
MRAVEWEVSRIHELDLTSTELSSECLMDILCRCQGFTYLGLGYCEFFSDKVSDFLYFHKVCNRNVYSFCSQVAGLKHKVIEKYLEHKVKMIYKNDLS